MKSTLSRRRGLTLIELSIVIVVLAIIIGVVTYNLNKSGATMDAAKALQLRAQSTGLKMDLGRYQDEFGSVEDNTPLSVMAKRDPEHPSWTALNEKDVLDPWGTPYYTCRDPEGEQQICTRGPDKKEGGEGKDADFMLTREDLWPAWLKKK